MNYKEEFNNIAKELKRQSDLILSPKAHQTNSLLQILVSNLNQNKVKIAEYHAKINVYQKYHNLEDFVNESEVIKEYMFASLCIDNIIRENQNIQEQIDKILNLYE